MDAAVRNSVVVGVDGAEEARAAIRWAACEAARRDAPLHLVHAAPYPYSGDAWAGGYAAGIVEELDALAQQTLESATELVRATAGVEVHGRIAHEQPRAALLSASEGAGLLVTGARRRNRLRAGTLGGFQLGSTSLYLASHAPCPTVVVRDLPAEGAAGVVVGHDTSPGSQAALEWAGDRANATGQHLTVVSAWQTPADPAFALDRAAHRRARETTENAVGRRIAAAVAGVRREHPALQVDGELIENAYPSDALLSVAVRSSLVVVGARGRSAFAGALLGSTSHAVLHRATCPVVVVPDPERARARERASAVDEPVG